MVLQNASNEAFTGSNANDRIFFFHKMDLNWAKNQVARWWKNSQKKLSRLLVKYVNGIQSYRLQLFNFVLSTKLKKLL